MKNKVAVFFDWYLPGMNAGGPVKSIYSIVSSITDIDFTVFTSDRDLKAETAYKNILLNEEKQYDYGKVYYSSFGFSDIKKACEYIIKQGYTTVYLNNLYSIKSFLIPYLFLRKKNIKIVVASRGMLGAGSIQLKSAKKKIYLRFLNWVGVRNVHWHVSTEDEKNEVLHIFKGAKNISIARNISKAITSENSIPEKESGKVELVSLSRISPVKNTAFLLKSLSQLKNGKGIRLHLYGPAEDINYYNECKNISAQITNGAEVFFHGAVAQKDITTVFEDKHFFCLSTLNENFGHVIAEAAAHRCPLVISQFTPWTEAIQKHNAGYIININNVNDGTTVFEALHKMTNEEYQAFVHGVTEMNTECFSINNKLKAKYVSLFS